MKKDFSKFKNARKVTFTKDWKRYKKGDVAAMHVNMANKVEADKAGKVSKIDFDGIREKAAKAKKKAEKKILEAQAQ